jgi:outer membrane protein
VFRHPLLLLWMMALTLGPVLGGGSLFAADLIQIYQEAAHNDPQLQGVYFQTQATKEERKQAIARFFPTVYGEGEYKQTQQDIVSSDNTVFGSGSSDYGSQSYSLNLTQPILRWELIVGLWQSKAESLRAEAELQMAKQDLIVRVVKLYLDALAAQDRLDYAQAEQAAVAKHLELATGRHRMGLIPKTDLHDAKARMATTQAKTISAQNDLDDALQALREVTGAPVDSLLGLRTEIPLASPEPADMKGWIEGAVQQNLGVTLQKHAVEVARYEVQRQWTGHYPSVDLVASWGNEETDGSLFGGGSEVETGEIGVRLTVPLFEGGRVHFRVRQARFQLSAARQELVRREREVARQARFAYLGVNSSLSRVDALRQSVISNRLALEAKQEGFMSGLYTSLNVLDAERDLSLVSIDHAQARYDYILNSLKLKQAVGTLEDKDLMEISRWFGDRAVVDVVQ